MVAKPFTFTTGTFAKSSQINANFDTIYSSVNTNITDIASLEASVDNLDSSKANINGSSTQRFQVDNAVNSYDAINKQTFEKITSNIKNYIYGYEITKDTNSPYDTVIVSAGSCYDSTYSTIITITSDTSVHNTSQGGNTTYYLHVISNDDGTSTKIIVSPSSVSPSLPTGYTKYRCVGKYTTASSDYNNRILRIFNYSPAYKGPTEPDYANKKAVSFTDGHYDVLEDGFMYVAINCIDSLQHVYVDEAPVVSGCGYSGGRAVIHGSMFKVTAGNRVRYTSSLADTPYFYPLKA